MSALSNINLKSYAEKFNCSNFIETGAGQGDGIAYASQIPFSKIISIEICQSQVEHLSKRFSADSRISVLHGNGPDVLDTLLPSIRGNTFFWLDAHFPESECGDRVPYDYEKDLEKGLPLENELMTILKHRRGFRDVIICDDLRIYERGPFSGKNLEDIGLGHLTKYGTEFLNGFIPTHDIYKTYSDTGLIILLPK